MILASGRAKPNRCIGTPNGGFVRADQARIGPVDGGLARSVLLLAQPSGGSAHSLGLWNPLPLRWEALWDRPVLGIWACNP